MNSNSFLTDAHQYIDDSYAKFVEYQDLVEGIFNVFHNICRENNIPYYLAFGTLLGRVRDGGRLPWDYDADVCVPYNKIDALIKILREQLPSDYFFECAETNKDFLVCMMRIGKKGYNLMRFHLDVFYFLGAPESEKEINRFQKKVQKVCCAKIRLYDKKPLEGNSFTTGRKVSNYFKSRLLSFPYCKFNVNYCYRRLVNKYDIEKAKYWIVCSEHAEYFPVEVLGAPKLYSDSLGEYYGPTNQEEFLTIRYGDYKNHPSIADQFKEFFFYYSLLNKEERSK